MYPIKQIKQDLKKMLSEYRYEHSLMVADESKKLALHYGYDSEKAYVAGLTHDIAKEFSNEENLKWIDKYNLSKELLNPEILPIIHANIGAVVVKEMYNFDDEICNSIKYHTTAHVPMLFLEKIIFVADKIARKDADESLQRLQKLAYEDLDLVIYECIKYSKIKLEKIGRSVQPETEQLFKELKKIYN